MVLGLESEALPIRSKRDPELITNIFDESIDALFSSLCDETVDKFGEID